MAGSSPVALESLSAGAALTPGAAARRLGVAVSTLRSWDRRHGLGPSRHEPGRHRRYTAGDVRLLARVRDLVDQGVPIARAVAVAKSDAGGHAAAPSGPSAVPHTGGIPPKVVARRRRILRRAATALDADAFRRVVLASLTEHGTVETWERLLVPLLAEIGAECTAATGPIEVEHVATDGIVAALHAVAPPPGDTGESAPVLLAGAPDEQHTLPLEVLRRALAERRRGSVFLGARVPPATLLTAVRRRRPADVVIWAHTLELAAQVPVADVLDAGARLVVAGPGWSGVALPDAVRWPATLTEAVELLE